MADAIDAAVEVEEQDPVQQPQPEEGQVQESSASLKRKASSPQSPTADDSISPKKAKLDEGQDPSPTTKAANANGNGTSLHDEKPENGHSADIPAKVEPAKEPETTRPRGTENEVKGQPESREDLKTTPPRPAPKSQSQNRPSERRPSDTGPERRRDFSQEERRRGQRLFGGLLSTLSQKASGPQQRRRQEIEKKQQVKVQQRRTEDDKRKSEKLSKLEHARKVEQVKFDEQAMRTRHSSMIAMAHSLKTSSHPPLYYRPWELTRRQEEIIQGQIRDAEATVAREVQEFEHRKSRRLKDLGVDATAAAVSPTTPTRRRPSFRGDSTAGEPHNTESPTTSTTDTKAIAAVSPSTNRPRSKHGHGHHHPENKDHDDNRDIVVETEEDTVIY